MSLLSFEEARMRLSIAAGYKAQGSMYLMSHDTYQRLGESVKHYLSTGQLVVVCGELCTKEQAEFLQQCAEERGNR